MNALKEHEMTTHITKTWFDGERVVTQEIPESEVYKQEAVAHLIAAAPDLLDALETALDGWQREFEYLAKRTPEWVTKARAAIAKATGEQP